MARVIVQNDLFVNYWEQIENSPELERIKAVLRILPDEEFIRKLERATEHGRKDYSVRYKWNLLVTMILIGVKSIAEFHKELKRNPTLVKICGGRPRRVWYDAIPSYQTLCYFKNKIKEHIGDLKEIINKMLEEIQKELPDLGENIAVDSTVIHSRSSHLKNNKESEEGEEVKRDERRENDAEWGKKKYYSEDNKLLKEETFLGFKLHVMVDVKYEIPLVFIVTPGNVNDTTQLLPLIKELQMNNSELMDRVKYVIADRGYDSRENNRELVNRYGVTPLIEARRLWKDKAPRALKTDKVDNIMYDEHGNLYCVDPVTEKIRRMAPMGYEKKRGTLKFRCPAAAYGLDCIGQKACMQNYKGKSSFGRVVRVPIKIDERVFTPVLRDSAKWERIYKGRTAVERFNGRIKNILNLDSRNFRNLPNIELKAAISILAMVGMFLARLKYQDMEHLRSFYAPLKKSA